ncbi:hypothetical protein D3C87_2151370 [compost metagenome]
MLLISFSSFPGVGDRVVRRQAHADVCGQLFAFRVVPFDLALHERLAYEGALSNEVFKVQGH